MSYRPRLLLPALATVALAAPALAATATVPPPTSSPKPPLAAKLTACEVGVGTTAGNAVFTGSMPAAKGAKRLWMRFDLERLPFGEEEWETLPASTFGQWVKSRPDVSGFVYSKRVEGLAAPAAYRSVVRFRWVDARGRAVRNTRKVTPACKQPDPRPNLTVVRLRPATTPAGPVAEVTIRNTGRADTLAPAVVTLSVAGVEQPAQTVPPLGPGVTATVTFPLPSCPSGSRMEAVVDPADGIDEALETDNVRLRTCG